MPLGLASDFPACLSESLRTDGFDESDDLATMQSAFGQVQRVTKGRLPTFTTAHLNQTVACLDKYHVDALCPISSWLGTTPVKSNTSKLEAEKTIWTYTSLQPYTKQGYNNLRLDDTLLQAQLLGWDMWITNVTGYLYCTIVMLPDLSLFPPR